ncbi:unnamed protein product [Caretta caretta]
MLSVSRVSHIPSPSPASSLPVLGENSEEPCTFPFRYKGRKYTACTMDDRKRPWCATMSNYEADHKWRYCSMAGMWGQERHKEWVQFAAGMGSTQCNRAPISVAVWAMPNLTGP